MSKLSLLLLVGLVCLGGAAYAQSFDCRSYCSRIKTLCPGLLNQYPSNDNYTEFSPALCATACLLFQDNVSASLAANSTTAPVVAAAGNDSNADGFQFARCRLAELDKLASAPASMPMTDLSAGTPAISTVTSCLAAGPTGGSQCNTLARTFCKAYTFACAGAYNESDASMSGDSAPAWIKEIRDIKACEDTLTAGTAVIGDFNVLQPDIPKGDTFLCRWYYIHRIMLGFNATECSYAAPTSVDKCVPDTGMPAGTSAPTSETVAATVVVVSTQPAMQVREYNAAGALTATPYAVLASLLVAALVV